jgi:pimeloyl-ACP methyl ester carboxylesterase
MATAAARSVLLLSVLSACSALTDGERGSEDVTSGSGATIEDCATFAPTRAILAAAAPDEAAKLTCATLSMPERRTPRSARTVKLSYVVAKATRTNVLQLAPPTPLVMVAGGPSAPSTDLLALLLPGGAFARIRRDRDVILVAERGEEHATPQLSCEELDALVPTMFGADGQLALLTEDRVLAATEACAKRHAAAGVDLGAYNAREMAADVRDAVHAAGFERFSVWGASFGAGLAQLIAKLYPKEVVSLVLDSPLLFSKEPNDEHMLTGNVHLDTARAVNDAFQTLFDECKKDVDGCHARFGDLEAKLHTLLDDFDAHPADMPVPGRNGEGTFNYRVTGQVVYQQLVSAFADATMVKLMPRLIAGLATRDPTTLAIIGAQIAKTVVPAPDVSSGLTLSVDCSGWSFADEHALPTKGVDDIARRYMTPVWALELRQCARAWHVPHLEDSWHGFAKPLEDGALPALIFAAKYDAVSHPYKAEQIHGYLPRSFVHVVPDRGHIASIHDCAARMMSAFLSDPSKDPNATCLALMTPTFL